MLKDTHQIGLKKVFVINKVKNTVPWTYVINDLKVKKLLEHFMKKNCKRLINLEFRIEKVLRKKGDKLYVKWKGHDISFNSWIDKKDLV